MYRAYHARYANRRRKLLRECCKAFPTPLFPLFSCRSHRGVRSSLPGRKLRDYLLPPPPPPPFSLIAGPSDPHLQNAMKGDDVMVPFFPLPLFLFFCDKDFFQIVRGREIPASTPLPPLLLFRENSASRRMKVRRTPLPPLSLPLVRHREKKGRGVSFPRCSINAFGIPQKSDIAILFSPPLLSWIHHRRAGGNVRFPRLVSYLFPFSLLLGVPPTEETTWKKRIIFPLFSFFSSTSWAGSLYECFPMVKAAGPPPPFLFLFSPCRLRGGHQGMRNNGPQLPPSPGARGSGESKRSGHSPPFSLSFPVSPLLAGIAVDTIGMVKLSPSASSLSLPRVTRGGARGRKMV